MEFHGTFLGNIKIPWTREYGKSSMEFHGTLDLDIDAELWWCFLRSASEQTFGQTIMTLVIWCYFVRNMNYPLLWRHNGRDGVSNHQSQDCLLKLHSGGDQRKHQSSASLTFMRGIQWWPVSSPHKWPVTRKMFPFNYVIMQKKPHGEIIWDLTKIYRKILRLNCIRLWSSACCRC